MHLSRLVSGISALALSVAGATLVVGASPAQALQSAVPSNTAPAYQTNGAVSTIAYAAGIVYIGGDFTSVRPPGAAPGSGEVGRTRLAAFNASTGALITSFNHTVPASVKSLATSPDGSVLYIGGDFTSIDGTTRNRVAAFSTSTGALTSWNPNASNRVSAIAATASTVYLGGTFSKVGSLAEQRVAAVSASGTGPALAGFTTSADNLPYQMALSPDGSRLYLAGAFLSLNGNTSYHAAGAVDASTGATLPFSAGSIIPPKTDACIVEAKTVKTDGDGAYFGVEGSGGGCFDGTFGVKADGSLKWQSACLGATQAVQPINGVLYTGSHSHDCVADQPGGYTGLNDPDAFPEVGWSKGISRHLLSRSTTDGKVGSWYPNTNGGPNGQGLGPRSMASDGKQLFVGGEFTTVNGQAQQGFARFSPSTGDTAAPAAPTAPTAVARGGGKVSVFVQAPLDTDDTDLTVSLYRDGGTTPIATKNVHALFWRDPVVGFTDNDQAVGSKHTYRADAREVNGSNVGPKSGASNSVTVVSAAPSYAAAVAASNPASHWRLGDTHAPAVADSSDQLEGGVAFGGVTFNQPGITGDDNAIVTDGVSGIVSSTDAMPSPSTFSVEAWFKTTSTTGGKIIGFGDRQQGYDFSGNPALSGSYDKQVYLTNDGRLKFGVYNGGADTLTSAAGMNDGAWHQVVGTQGPGGMVLYVDGARVGRNGVTTNQSYPGYWRVGGDNLNGWPDQPSSNYFAGSIDEVATYGRAITLSDVQAHYAAAGRTPPPSTLPTDTYGRAVAGDSPSAYWRLDETAGTRATDSSDNGDAGTYVGGVTQGVPGALGGQGKAATFDGQNGNVVETSQRGGPAAFTAELWFNTSTSSGGKLIGFGNAQTGMSGSYDKQVYMTNDGRLVFGNYNGGFDTLYTDKAYNDGTWHYVVATQGADGMKLYVDNALKGSNGVTNNQAYGGFWRAGGDNLNAWPDQPSSAYFAGTMDEVALYDAPLSAVQVNDHYVAAGRNGQDVTAPETAITSPQQDDVVTSGTVAVKTTASDAVGVTSVDLLADGNLVGTDTVAPYTFDWTATDGPHTLQTKAHDAAGNIGTSGLVQVTGTTPDTTDPTTSITSPSDGATVSGPTTVTADAADNRGVTTMKLQVDGTTVDTSTSTSSPYTFTWNAATSGQHTLRTVASDAAGNTGTSAPVTVNVPVAADTTAPSAPTGLTATATGQTTVDLSWTGSTDNVGVTGYRVVRDGTVVATIAGTSYSDTGLTAGTGYSYVVRAVDAAGNVSADSQSVTVTTAAAADPALFSDTWSGADGSPWKSGWTTGQANGSIDTQSGQGQLAFTDVANAYARAQITGAPAQADTELLTSYRWSSTAAGSYLNVYLRGSGGWQNAYRPKNGYGLELTSNSGTVVVRKNVASTTTNLASVTGGQAVTTDKQWLRVRVSGSTVQFRTWRDGTTEPTAWKGSFTDTAVTAPGQVFVSLVRGGTSTGTKSVSLDDLRLTQP